MGAILKFRPGRPGQSNVRPPVYLEQLYYRKPTLVKSQHCRFARVHHRQDLDRVASDPCPELAILGLGEHRWRCIRILGLLRWIVVQPYPGDSAVDDRVDHDRCVGMQGLHEISFRLDPPVGHCPSPNEGHRLAV